MWGNAYNTYGNGVQRDMLPSNWLNQTTTPALSNPYGFRFDNYQGATTNPFAGQIFGSSYQPYNFANAFNGYQYRG